MSYQRKSHLKLQITPFFLWVAFLALVMAAGVYAGIQVLLKGLVVTNLTDIVPWGMWITVDLSSIAVSAGAFLLCAGVYLLGLKQYQPLARTATFIGLIGYSMAVLTLMLDIGRPDRFWHALVYWNPESPLWEVTMCVTLYLCVLVMEAAPIFGQAEWLRNRWPKLSAALTRVHHLAPYLAVAGLCLSMLHQSSLGATYGIIKAKPIWYRPDLSVLFMASAMAAGPALTMFVTTISGLLSKRVHVDENLVNKLAVFVGWTLVGYLYFRFWDALAMTYTYQPGKSESLNMLTQGTLSFNFWAGEILLGCIVPIILLLVPRFRNVPILRLIASAAVVGGLVAYRWDVNMSGELVLLTYLPEEIIARYTSYFPSLIEFLSGAGIVAYGVLAVSLAIRYLNLVDHRREPEHEVEPIAEPVAAD